MPAVELSRKTEYTVKAKQSAIRVVTQDNERGVRPCLTNTANT
jgi:hypothetical protein